jgi:hypothetical protein
MRTNRHFFAESKGVLAAIGLAGAFAFATIGRAEQFGDWEVEAPPGQSDTVQELIASRRLSISDLRDIEYLPRLSVACEIGGVGPYGRSRTTYKALKVRLSWFARQLPKDFEALQIFLAGDEANAVWVSYGRSWASGGPRQLITIGGSSLATEDPSAIETVKIEAGGSRPTKGYRFSAEILDSGVAEGFLRSWNTLGRIPVVILDAENHDLDRIIELQGMKLAVDRVFARCGRGVL